MERNIGFKERRYIEELRILTKSTALDCVIDDRFDRVIYVIRPGDMGLAIGKKGDNIKRLQSVLGKRIEMVEYAENRGRIYHKHLQTGRSCEDRTGCRKRAIECVCETEKRPWYCDWKSRMQYRKSAHPFAEVLRV